MSEVHHLRTATVPFEKGLFDLVPCGLVVCNAQGYVLRVNGFFKEMSGLADERFIESRPFQQYLTRPSRFIFNAKILPQLILTGEAREMTLDIAGADGEGIAVLLNANYDQTSNQHHFAIFPAKDRREHERQLLKTQQDLIQSRDYLQMAEKLANVGHFHNDLETQATFWSPEIYNIVGCDPKTYSPRLGQVIDFYHADDRDHIKALLAEAVRTGEGFSFQSRIVRQDTGELRHVEASAVCQRDGRGVVTGLFGVIHDITDIIQAQADIAASESRYRLLADNASDVITVIDLDGRIEYASPSIEAMLGFAPEHFIGRAVCEFVLPEDYEATEKAYRDYLLSRNWDDAPHARYRIRHADGHLVWLEAHPKAIVGPDGRLEKYQDVVRDITVQKATEDALAIASIEARAAAEAKAQFLATMSHELRTPLTSIIGYSSLLRDLLTGDDSLRRHSLRIHSAGQGLLALINDILDHSKLEAGQLALDIEPCSVPDLAHDVLDLLTIQADAKGLDLILNGVETVPDDLMLDEQRLRQILMNLASNAIKFTDTGRVTMNVTWHESHLHLSVTDTGQGIALADQARLFQRFSQINKTANNQNGTGLGLLICKQLVELMGGCIGVDSAVGQGSTFRFDIPAVRVADFTFNEAGEP